MWFSKLFSRDKAQDTAAAPLDESEANERFIDFLYQIFFNRNAEQGAIDHWKPYLERGTPPLDLFLALWKSAEFANKAQQNLYIKAPRSEADIEQARQDVVTPGYFKDVIAILENDRQKVLEVASVRAAVAQWRYRDLTQDSAVKTAAASALAVPDTIPYSEFTLRSYVADDRPSHMIRPLLSIGRVAENVAKLKVLSIGPRTETELFALLAGGFALENIKMIDLVSYSPYVQVGDMHEMTFADNAFDVVVFGDVLAYSKKPDVAVKEILRVAKSGAILTTAHGLTKGFIPLFGKPGEAKVDPAMGLSVQTTDDILDRFRPHVGQIYFRCEPGGTTIPQLNRVLVVFEILK